MSAPTLETLLRGSALAYGHIQLFRDNDGWQASVCHYAAATVDNANRQVDSKVFADPTEALRKALLEDDRRTRDLERRYAAAPKAATPPADEFEDILG